MIVYHGSNADIEEIDLTKGSRFKDFGQGFYATPDLETAQRMARKKAKLFGGEPTILVYEFQDEKVAESGLKMKVFPEKATAEWIRFIDKNRDKQQGVARHDYDIVQGPKENRRMEIKLNPTHKQMADYLTDHVISEMTKYLMEDYGYSLEKALDVVYTSKTVELLQIEEGELYVQSPAYVYDMLLQELHLYPMPNDDEVRKVADDSTNIYSTSL